MGEDVGGATSHASAGAGKGCGAPASQSYALTGTICPPPGSSPGSGERSCGGWGEEGEGRWCWRAGAFLCSPKRVSAACKEQVSQLFKK